jgi:hypothetical protein
LVNVLALDKLFYDFEFIHSYIGPQELKILAKKKDPKKAYQSLKDFYKQIDYEIKDEFPFFRKTYIKDFIRSVLVQVDFFVFKNNKLEFKNIVEDIHGSKLIPKFNIEYELEKLEKFINNLGYKSIIEFRKKDKKISFDNRRKLIQHINKIIYEFYEITLQKYSKIFSIDLNYIFEKSNIKIEESKIKAPCYYIYNGNYKAKVGLKLKKKYSDSYLRGFICHEVLPGHHFYYLVKQYLINNNKIDLINSMDTFYSPENIINEGLATNADLILNDKLDEKVLGLIKIEKFLHKIFYNIWHVYNIEKRSEINKNYCEILTQEIGFTKNLMAKRIKYFSNYEKYYAISYPIGLFYVEKYLKKLGLENLMFFYGQNSLNTIKKIYNE